MRIFCDIRASLADGNGCSSSSSNAALNAGFFDAVVVVAAADTGAVTKNENEID